MNQRRSLQFQIPQRGHQHLPQPGGQQHSSLAGGWGIDALLREQTRPDKEDLAGEGLIAGVAIRCLSPAMQVLCHTGFVLPAAQLRDLALLHDRFGVEVDGRRDG